MTEVSKMKTATISEISILVIHMMPSLKTTLGNSLWNTNFKYIQNLQNLLKILRFFLNHVHSLMKRTYISKAVMGVGDAGNVPFSSRL